MVTFPESLNAEGGGNALTKAPVAVCNKIIKQFINHIVKQTNIQNVTLQIDGYCVVQ